MNVNLLTSIGRCKYVYHTHTSQPSNTLSGFNHFMVQIYRFNEYTLSNFIQLNVIRLDGKSTIFFFVTAKTLFYSHCTLYSTPCVRYIGKNLKLKPAYGTTIILYFCQYWRRKFFENSQFAYGIVLLNHFLDGIMTRGSFEELNPFFCSLIWKSIWGKRFPQMIEYK